MLIIPLQLSGKLKIIEHLKEESIRKLVSCFGELTSSREEICSAENKLICKMQVALHFMVCFSSRSYGDTNIIKMINYY